MGGYIKNAVRQIRTLSKAEQASVLKVTGEHVDGFRDHMILSVALGTALREGEISGLNVGDVARGPNEIRARIDLRIYARKGGARGKAAAGAVAKKPTKSDVHQRVFLPKLVRRKLAKYLTWKKRNKEAVGPDAPLFVSSRGDRIACRTMRHMFRTWQTRAGFPSLFTFHELRHTSLTNLYAATKDILLVKKQGRHVDVATTQLYAHVSDEDVRRAVDSLIA